MGLRGSLRPDPWKGRGEGTFIACWGKGRVWDSLGQGVATDLALRWQSWEEGSLTCLPSASTWGEPCPGLPTDTLVTLLALTGWFLCLLLALPHDVTFFFFSHSPSLFSSMSALWARFHQHGNNKDVARFLVPPCCDPIWLSSVFGHGLWSQPFLLSGKDSQSASYFVSENQEISLTVSPQLLLLDQIRPGNSRWLEMTCIDILFFSLFPTHDTLHYSFRLCHSVFISPWKGA